MMKSECPRGTQRTLLLLPLLALLSGCGGGSSGGNAAQTNASVTAGALVFNPPLRAASLTAADFQANLDATASGQGLHYLAAPPATPGGPPSALKCGVDIYKIQFNTLGGASEPTQSSGALMVPTGSSPFCSAPHPVVLYAHGTSTDRSYDLANLADSTNPANGESALIAAVYASNGFIVVAPNYAGYDISTLGYHPYLNAAQQAGEMQHALQAARTALASLPVNTDPQHLFVSGYSQGGHVAMATVRALEAAGTTVTAAAPMSGPYAMGAFGDIIFSGTVDIGATLFLPLLSTSYQKAYGNLYGTPGDFYSATYASGIETLLPSTLSQTQLFTQGKLPQTALFNDTPTGPFAGLPGTGAGRFGFGSPYLVNDSARATYLADAAAHPDGAVPTPTTGLPATTTNPVRAALVRNDLRVPLTAPTQAMPGWLPKAPMLLCAGGNDPVVFSVNTVIMAGYFGGVQAAASPAITPAPLRHVLNIDLNASGAGKLPAAPDSDPVFGALQQAFTGTYNQQAGSTAATQQAALIGYHGSVAPFCTAASVSFFAAPR